MNSNKPEKGKSDFFNMFKCGPDYKDFYKEFLVIPLNDYNILLYFVDYILPRTIFPAETLPPSLHTASPFCTGFRCHPLQNS